MGEKPLDTGHMHQINAHFGEGFCTKFVHNLFLSLGLKFIGAKTKSTIRTNADHRDGYAKQDR